MERYTSIRLDALISTLEATPELVTSLVESAPAEVRKSRLIPGKWSLHEHACHVREPHPVFEERLQLILRMDQPFLEPLFPAEGQRDGYLLERDLQEELEKLRSERLDIVNCLRTLSPEQWMRSADHPEYERYDVFIMFRHLALHDMFHLYRMEELLLKPIVAKRSAVTD